MRWTTSGCPSTPCDPLSSSRTAIPSAVHSFAGEATAPGRLLPAGAMYAVHDDHGVAAFGWRELAAAFGLTVECEDGSGPEPR